MAAGSVDDSRSVSAGLKAGTGPWVLAVDAVKRESGDYRTPVAPVSERWAAMMGATPLDDRTVRNTDVAVTAYGAGAAYVGAGGYLGASVKRTTSRYGLPFPQVEAAGASEGEGPVFVDLAQTRWDVRGEQSLDWGLFDRIRGSLGYADYRHSEVSATDGSVGTTFLSDGVEGRAELVHREHDGHQGAIGVQGLRRSLQARGDEAFVPPVEIEEGGLFTLQRLDRGGWGIEGGLRADQRTLTAELAGRPPSEAALAGGTDWARADASRRFTNLSASMAAFWRPRDGWFLSLGLAHNRRAPTEFELFADGPHAGTGAYEVGDPTLRSESVESVEGTLRWTVAAARLEAHLYAARYRGFIDMAFTGVRANDDGSLAPDGALPVLRFTQSAARFHGGELEASFPIWRGGGRTLSLEGAVDMVRGTTDAGPAARIPPASATGRVVWEGPKLEARLEVRRVADQARVAAFELPTDGYTLINAQVTATPFADRDLRVFLDGRNLADAAAREHVSFLKDIAPLPGRTVRLGLGYSF
jgi:iron complex outermembrane receptor protein